MPYVLYLLPSNTDKYSEYTEISLVLRTICFQENIGPLINTNGPSKNWITAEKLKKKINARAHVPKYKVLFLSFFLSFFFYVTQNEIIAPLYKIESLQYLGSHFFLLKKDSLIKSQEKPVVIYLVKYKCYY